jgi:hypothetical protein
MEKRKASVVVCDELLFNLAGKVTMSGMYTSSDIAIVTPELRIGQLVFFFAVETPIQQPIDEMSLEVIFPNGSPYILQAQIVPANPLLLNSKDRKSYTVRHPFMIQNATLTPGEIKAAVLVDGVRIDAGSVWISNVTDQKDK